MHAVWSLIALHSAAFSINEARAGSGLDFFAASASKAHAPSENLHPGTFLQPASRSSGLTCVCASCTARSGAFRPSVVSFNEKLYRVCRLCDDFSDGHHIGVDPPARARGAQPRPARLHAMALTMLINAHIWAPPKACIIEAIIGPMTTAEFMPHSSSPSCHKQLPRMEVHGMVCSKGDVIVLVCVCYTSHVQAGQLGTSTQQGSGQG